ncbi:MAG: RNA 2',3'-cyclic phosphodiesterase [Rhizomicrobium sp.]
MQRLFVALSIPDDVALSLAPLQNGVPGARWQTREQLHLTLRFIGEIEGRDANAVHDALSVVDVPAFSLALHSVGEFGGKRPSALWAGVRSNEALMHLQRKIETSLQRVGLPADRKRYTPHVTLARLRGTQQGHVMDYLTDHALYSSRTFTAGAFILYSSLLTSDGSVYRAEHAYRLKEAT